jgi:hypothetical protein
MDVNIQKLIVDQTWVKDMSTASVFKQNGSSKRGAPRTEKSHLKWYSLSTPYN